MQRIIKFRGKRVDNGEWVYGDLYQERKPFHDEITDVFIVEWRKDLCLVSGSPSNNHWWRKVDPETVGQFTGLTDKKGKEIYEGDKLSHHKKASLYKDCPIEIIGAVVYTNGKFETETIKVINENFLDNSSIHFGIEPIDWIHLPNFKESEAIGNIYENSDLLEK